MWNKIQRIYVWTTKVRPMDYLYFIANTAGSTITLSKTWSPTAVTIETSTDGSTRSTYTFGTTITLSSAWSKVYFRNTSPTPTWFSTNSSNVYTFSMTWSIAARGDINFLLCKKSTTTIIGNACFLYLFQNCTALTSCPSLPATTLTQSCYASMFRWCTNLTTLPNLPALTWQQGCYQNMFRECSKIKMSYSQTWDYQTEYRIPTTWTWVTATNATSSMFYQTGWTYTSNPTVNTTYYTSNTLV